MGKITITQKYKYCYENFSVSQTSVRKAEVGSRRDIENLHLLRTLYNPEMILWWSPILKWILKDQFFSSTRFVGFAVFISRTSKPKTLQYLEKICNNKCIKRININNAFAAQTKRNLPIAMKLTQIFSFTITFNWLIVYFKPNILNHLD